VLSGAGDREDDGHNIRLVCTPVGPSRGTVGDNVQGNQRLDLCDCLAYNHACVDSARLLAANADKGTPQRGSRQPESIVPELAG
jgi:hypothetical protein